MTVYSVDKLIAETRRLASEYRRATGKPLPLSGEIARHDAARLLDLELAEEGAAGFDAIGRGPREGRRVQIKGRAIFDEFKSGQRIGQVKRDQAWDLLVLVLMDEEFEPYEIWEADRETMIEALDDPSASKRSKRGAMSIARFKIIGRLAWTREHGTEGTEPWSNDA